MFINKKHMNSVTEVTAAVPLLLTRTVRYCTYVVQLYKLGSLERKFHEEVEIRHAALKVRLT